MKIRLSPSLFYHLPYVQVFDRYEVVLFCVVVRELGEKVVALLSEVGVTLRNAPSLLLPVVRPVLFARELPLLALQAITLVREVERPDRRAVGVVDVLENSHIDRGALVGFLRRLRRRSISALKVANHSPSVLS